VRASFNIFAPYAFHVQVDSLLLIYLPTKMKTSTSFLKLVAEASFPAKCSLLQVLENNQSSFKKGQVLATKRQGAIYGTCNPSLGCHYFHSRIINNQ
jgi:hypothetical protein